MENYTRKLLGMEDVQIENFEETEDEIRITLSLDQCKQTCPRCKVQVEKVHDYYSRQLRDLELHGKMLRLIYRKRRYSCPHCGKRFSEACSFAGRYQRFTHRVTEKIISLLGERKSFRQIALDSGTSLSGVRRVLNILAVPHPHELPHALSFDEFKGDTDGRKFQCIITDPEKHKVFDILPSRSSSDILDYLKKFDNRSDVKYVVMDMNKNFRDIALALFPNAQIIIDRFHVVRYCTQAMENVRIELQKSLPKEQRRYFKRSRRLLLAHRDKLSQENKIAVDVMLRFSDKLTQAYALKEAFYSFMASPNRAEAERRLNFWFDACDRLHIPQFSSCRTMLRNWKPYILNAFDIHLSNGFTEGCNNAIKVLKRACFGFRNFSSFRKRILLSFYLHP